MKNLHKFLLAFLFVAALFSMSRAQDVVSVNPVHDPNYPCAFNLTFTNHNIALKNIDGVSFELISGNGIQFDQLRLPAQWSNGVDLTPEVKLTATANNAGIAPNGSLSGFLLDYIDNFYETPVVIKWVAFNGLTPLDSGTVQTICTQYQSYSKIDTATSVQSVSGCDPCFTFSVINRNLQGGQTLSIKGISFELITLTAGTMRPSKITAPTGWTVDSVTKYRAYFHTENNILGPGDPPASGFKVCLRGNPSATKFSFVWRTYDEAGSFIDRDTMRDIPNTVGCATADADSVVAAAPNGCLYDVSLKNYHVSNTLPPSPIVRFALYSKTAGVTFASTPNAPLHWSKRKSTANDSVIYTSDSISHGIPGGIIEHFTFSVEGSSTSSFSLGWETDQAAAPFPPKFVPVTTGTLNLSCAAAIAATDSATIKGGATECSFVLTIKNTHNIIPQSNLTQTTITIPAGTGQLTATGSSSGWDVSSITPTQIKFQAPTGEGMPPSATATQDLAFTFSPKNPGQDVTATWVTKDDQGNSTGTGNVTLNCAPTVTTCDTLNYGGFTANQTTSSHDSCDNMFTLVNRKSTDITSIVITPTDGWHVDSASTPAGWTKVIDFAHTSVTYTSATGLKANEHLDLTIKFSGYFLPTQVRDSFIAFASTTDRNGVVCTSTDSINGCLAHLLPGGAVHTEYTGANNFTVQPNPSHGEAEISFDMSTATRVIITVVDVLGHQVATVSSQYMTPGAYHIPYNLNNLSDGTYYIRMQTPLGVMTKKLILAK
jgi:hypothetical protein